jgi:hypothetical protein
MLTGTQTQVTEFLRRLCGIGVCNQWTPPGMFTACMGIAVGESPPCLRPSATIMAC